MDGPRREKNVAASINIPVYSDALVLLATAGVVVPLVKRSGFSPVLGYLCAGALLGPLGIGRFVGDVPLLYWFTVSEPKNLAGLADLGVVFLLFLIGLELSYERLWAMRRLVFGLGGTQIALSAVLIAGVAAWAGLAAPAAMVIGACLALSSTAVVLEVLSGAGRLKTSAGRASFAVLLAQDLAVIPILMFVSILGANAEASVAATVARALTQAALAVGIIVVVGRLFLRPLMRLVAGVRSSELFIAAILFVIVGTGVVAAAAGMSMALGAFIAGLLLAETEYRKAVEATMQPFKGLLLGLFFFTVGMSIDVRAIAEYPLALAASVIGLIGAKALIVVALGRLFKMSWAAALETGLMVGPGGEFAFVVIGLAMALGIMQADVAGFVLALASLSMALIPLLAFTAQRLGRRLRPAVPLARELAVLPAPPARHAIVVGHGRVGKVACAQLDHHGVPYTAADLDPAVVAEERRKGHNVFYGDASNADFLKACGIMDATALIVTIHDHAAIAGIVAGARRMRPDIQIVSRARDAGHARQLYSLGVSDAVPETVEASLQLSEAALTRLGVPADAVLASVQAERDRIRAELRAAFAAAGGQDPVGRQDLKAAV